MRAVLGLLSAIHSADLAASSSSGIFDHLLSQALKKIADIITADVNKGFGVIKWPQQGIFSCVIAWRQLVVIRLTLTDSLS
jgi:hypothetical protein